MSVVERYSWSSENGSKSAGLQRIWSRSAVAAGIDRLPVERRAAVEAVEAVHRQHRPKRRRDRDPPLGVEPVGEGRNELVHRHPRRPASARRDFTQFRCPTRPPALADGRGKRVRQTPRTSTPPQKVRLPPTRFRDYMGYHGIFWVVNGIGAVVHGVGQSRQASKTLLGLTIRLDTRIVGGPNGRCRRPCRTAAPHVASRPVSRVLYGGVAAARRPFLWDVRCRTPRATYPDGWPGNGPEA